MNNPLFFYDELGLRLKVWGVPGDRAHDAVQAGLDEFDSTPRGQEIEETIGNTDIYIYPDNTGTNRYYGPDDPSNPFRDPFIRIDPFTPVCLPTSRGQQDTPVSARIAHEAGHAVVGEQKFQATT